MKAKISRGEQRRMHAATERFQTHLIEAEGEAYQRGFSAGDTDGFKRGTAKIAEANNISHERGVKQGAAETRIAVLGHAGRLYQDRKDSDAAAVREVHRLLVEAAK